MLWPTVVSIFVLIMLISFGTWQIKRMFWKEALIDRYISQSQSNPIRQSNQLNQSTLKEFKSVELEGSFLHENEIYITGKTFEGNAGFHVITPFKLNNDSFVLINRGWVSEGYRNPIKRSFSLIKGKTTIKGILRLPQIKGYFVPENDGKNGFWFTIKPKQIFNHLNSESKTLIYN